MKQSPLRRPSLSEVVDLDLHPLQSHDFRTRCKHSLDADGVLVLDNFLRPAAIEALQTEGEDQQRLAYYTNNTHNIYLAPGDSGFADNHPRNREVVSSKGCITTDQIDQSSALHTLYDAGQFRQFLCAVFDEVELHEYADPLSSINLHYASEGQELGWHFDNSSFAISLLIQKPTDGGTFEYIKDVRDADAGEMNYGLSEKILNGEVPAKSLSVDVGALVLFRGRNSIHRVTPTEGDRTRILVVLAYNTEPGVSLSVSARMTFFGRLGDE
jgi:hypothetical protein